jgi:hypothetical protein
VGALRFPTLLGFVVVPALAVRFLSDVALAGANVGNETRVAVARALDGYEIALAVGLLFLFLLLTRPTAGKALRLWGWLLTPLLSVAFAVWLLTPGRLGFLAVSTGVLTLVAVFALRIRFPRRIDLGSWTSWAFLAFAALVPLVYALRSATALALVSLGGTEGWLFANVPTFLLELLALGVWMNLAMDARRAPGRLSWRPFVPFLLVPPVLAMFATRDLAGFILTFEIAWGMNLANFVPVLFSLGLALTAAACYVSAVLFLPRGERRRLLVTGTLLALLAGFLPSMASVAGLALSLVVSGQAVAPGNGTREAGGDAPPPG